MKAFLFKIGIYAYVRVDAKANSNVTAKEVFTSNLLCRCKRMLLRFTKYLLQLISKYDCLAYWNSLILKQWHSSSYPNKKRKGDK